MRKRKTNKNENLPRSAVTAELDMLTQKSPMFGNGIIQYLLINIMIISSMSSGLSYISLAPNLPLVFFYCALLSALLCFPKKKYAAIALLVATGLFFHRMWEEIVGGGAALLSQYLSLFDHRDSTINSFVPGSRSAASDQATLALIVYGLIMVLVLYECVFIHKNLVLTFFITFILPETGLYNGLVPSYLPTFALLISWICVFAMQLSDYNVNRRKETGTFTKTKRKSTYYLTGNSLKTSAFAQLSVQICIFVTSAVIVSMIATTISNHERSDNIDLLRKNLTTDFSYESFVKAVNQMQGGLNIKLNSGKTVDLGAADVSGGLAMGKLGNAYNLKFNGKTLMEITTDTPFATQPLYIRGYAAGDYTGDGWKVYDDWDRYIKNAYIAANGSGLINSFDKFGSLGMDGTLAQSVYGTISSSSEFSTIHVKDLTKSGVFFTPYFGGYYLSEAPDGEPALDGYLTLSAVQSDYATINKNEYYTQFMYLPNTSSVEMFADINYGSYDFDVPYYFVVRALMEKERNSNHNICDTIDRSPLITNQVTFFTRRGFLESICNFVNSFNAANMQSAPHYFVSLQHGDDEGKEHNYTDDDLSRGLDDMFKIVAAHSDGTSSIIAPSDVLYQLMEIYRLNPEAFGHGSLSDRDVEYMVYTDYVFSHYLDVDIDINPEISEVIDSSIDSLYSKFVTMPEFGNIINTPAYYPEYAESIISTLSFYFRNNYTYSLKVEKTPSDQDFIEYFLNEMNAGSCTYFSSAAVQILRSYGIPARYVEGFMVPPASAERIDDSNRYKIEVSDKYAHAWVEIYYPSIGWLPVEFTLADPNDINDPPEVQTTTTSVTTTTTTSATTTSPDVTTPAVTKPDETTSPSETTAVAAVTTEKSGGGLSAAAIKTIATVALIIVIIGFIIGGYIALREAIKKSIEDSISGKDENINCVNIYNLILRYLGCASISCRENISDKERCQKLCLQLVGNVPHDICEGLTDACMLAVEASMSCETLSSEDTERLRELLAKVKSECYDKMTSFQRFKAKYILALY